MSAVKWLNGARLAMRAEAQKNEGIYRYPRFFGTPEGTRTPDLTVRSRALYPAELQAHK